MSKVLKQPATYEDLLKVPDHLRAEIVEGELYTSPRPSGAHERAMSAISRFIGTRFDDGDGGPGGWWIAVEPEVHLSLDVFVPDLAGWRRERVPTPSAGPAWDVEPDWVCEVLSPSTHLLDRTRKLPLYAKYGVMHAWVVNPQDKSLEVYRRVEGWFALVAAHSGDEVARIQPFDAIEFPLSRLWLPAA
jgi:Uma2 family endonuclease